MENPTIDSIRALIILFKYYVINDLNSFASFVLGTAVRLALVIGLVELIFFPSFLVFFCEGLNLF